MTALLAFFALQVSGAAGGGALPLLMMGGIFAIFYVLLILPQQRRQKKWQQMLNELKPGDRVTTSGGLQGIILSIKNPEGADAGTITLRIAPDNLRMEFVRSAIVSVRTEDGPKS
ncbi:MAG TPA: preprotein translocase subunit YajC [candidate division Zixibacteria bacterium]|nr:preprotein translocase subunit YajC [candidate division Zixibacteria bacterium]